MHLDASNIGIPRLLLVTRYSLLVRCTGRKLRTFLKSGRNPEFSPYRTRRYARTRKNGIPRLLVRLGYSGGARGSVQYYSYQYKVVPPKIGLLLAVQYEYYQYDEAQGEAGEL